MEKDIVNKKIDQETIRRQQDIMVRMLEHERAEKEREMDNKRQSNEGRDTLTRRILHAFSNTNVPGSARPSCCGPYHPGLRPYYKQRVDEYFGTFDRH